MNSQVEQANWQVEQPAFLHQKRLIKKREESQLVARLESGVEYLRDQLDKQTQLLA